MSELIGRGVSRDRAKLAVRLAELRLRRDWNWTDLANHAGISWKQVAEIESGDRDPHFTTVLRLARALDIRSLDEVLGVLPLEAN